jgi:hypothetical protein
LFIFFLFFFSKSHFLQISPFGVSSSFPEETETPVSFSLDTIGGSTGETTAFRGLTGGDDAELLELFDVRKLNLPEPIGLPTEPVRMEAKPPEGLPVDIFFIKSCRVFSSSSRYYFKRNIEFSSFNSIVVITARCNSISATLRASDPFFEFS